MRAGRDSRIRGLVQDPGCASLCMAGRDRYAARLPWRAPVANAGGDTNDLTVCRRGVVVSMKDDNSK